MNFQEERLINIKICILFVLVKFIKIELNTTHMYGSGTVNSKSSVSKVLLRIKWKFELTVYFKHGILGKF